MARPLGYSLVMVALVLACGGRSERHELARDGGQQGGSGGALATTSGAGGAAGRSGAAGAAGRGCGLRIDDLEDGSGRICRGDGRVGVWYAFNDGTGTQWPELTEPGVPITISEIPGGRDGSERAVHTYGQDFTGWGAGVGFDLAFDGTTYRLYDASAYSGVTFWLRGDDSGTLAFRISDAASTYVAWGGTNASLGTSPASLTLRPTAAWTQYFVPFASLLSLDPAFSKRALTNVQFLSNGGNPFDFWVDDVAFFEGSADCCRPGCSSPIAFRDANLERAVALVATNQAPPVSCESACTALALADNGAGIASLDGLECLPHVESVVLSGNGIVDLTPLGGLGELTLLDVDTNAIVDLTPVKGLAQLVSLDVRGNRIANVDFLAELPRLEKLYLDRNPLGELVLDGGFPALTMLEARELPLGSVTLRDLPVLTTLDLSAGALTQAELKLPALSMLYVSDDQLASLTLAAPALTRIWAQHNALSTLEGLRGAPALEWVTADDNPLADISALGALPHLAYVSLANAGLDSSSLAALRGATLGYLRLSNNPITELDALADVNFAKTYLDALGGTIQLDGTEVSDLSPLAANRTLANFTVYLQGAPIDCRAQADNIATLAARLVSVIADCTP